MKIFVLSFALIASIAFSSTKADKDDGNCHIGGHTILPGQSANVADPCGNFECSKDAEGHLSLSSSGCALMALSPEMKSKCRFVPGKGEYPACCDQLKCDE